MKFHLFKQRDAGNDDDSGGGEGGGGGGDSGGQGVGEDKEQDIQGAVVDSTGGGCGKKTAWLSRSNILLLLLLVGVSIALIVTNTTGKLLSRISIISASLIIVWPPSVICKMWFPALCCC